MYQQDWSQKPGQPGHPRRGGRGWLSTLFIGILLFVVATAVMFWTGNVNLYPTVIIIGNFLIPIVFVLFLYDYQHISQLTPETIAKSFGIGGILGVIGASILEFFLVSPMAGANQSLSVTSGLLVGLIEEGCKIVVVMFMARRMRHTSALDGLLLGAAVGMGFAALESTGYAFTTFLLSQGRITASLIETIFRGLLAPFGHGVWTAILGSVVFRDSSPSNRFRLTIGVVLTYLFVSILHGFWDGLPHTIYLVIPPGISISVVNLVISVVGIAVLAVMYRRDAHPQVRQMMS